MKDKLVLAQTESRDTSVTRWVHVVLGLSVAATGAVLLVMGLTGLDFLGSNDEPGPGFFPAMVSGILVALGLALTAVWLIGPSVRRGDVTLLSLQPQDLRRAAVVWAALAGFTAIIEPLGFLVAGELFVLVLVLFVDRIRTWGLVLTLLLLPPAVYFLFATMLDVRLPEGTLWV